MLPNPPSIPSHDYVFGYEKKNKESNVYIRQKNSELVHTGVKDDKVGPGEYEVELKMTTKGPTKWVQKEVNSKILNLQQKKIGLQPGPGHY